MPSSFISPGTSQHGSIQARLAAASRAIVQNSGRGCFGSSDLRLTRLLLERLLLKQDVSLTISLFGDSWTRPPGRYSGTLAQYMASTYGNAVGGWVGFGYPKAGVAEVNGHALAADYPLSFTGVWESNYNSSWRSPDFCRVQSITPDSTLTVGFPAGMTEATLIYDAAGDAGDPGQLAYSWDVGEGYGEEIIADLLGNWGGHIRFEGVPATAGTLRIRITANGGNCRLCGVNFGSSQPGVRVNKLGADGIALGGGANSITTLSAPTQGWVNSLDVLETDLFVYLFGTNDQGGGRTGEQFEADLSTLVSKTKAAKPSADHLIVIACENIRPDNLYPMTVFRDAGARVARAQKAAFLDLQPLFGETPAEYAFGSARPWFAADMVHPDPDTGGKVIMSGIRRMIEHGSV